MFHCIENSFHGHQHQTSLQSYVQEYLNSSSIDELVQSQQTRHSRFSSFSFLCPFTGKQNISTSYYVQLLVEYCISFLQHSFSFSFFISIFTTATYETYSLLPAQTEKAFTVALLKLKKNYGRGWKTQSKIGSDIAHDVTFVKFFTCSFQMT